MRRALIGLAMMAQLLPQVAFADAEAAQSSVLMVRAWRCEQFAYYAKNEVEVERLFNLGYQAGQQFAEAAKAGKITKEDANSVVPMVVGMLWSGPSTEFMLGRVFEGISTDVGDEIMKQSLDGTPLDIGHWITDDELIQSRGSLKFDQANCALIK